MANLKDEGLRVRIVSKHNAWVGEEAVFSFYTGKRPENDYDGLTAAGKLFFEGLIGPSTTNILHENIEEFTVHVDEWQNPVLSADYWASAYSETTTRTPGATGGSLLPPQVSIVVSLQTFDSRVPQKRSRNRFYLPWLNDNFLFTNGRISNANQNILATEVQQLQNFLEAIPLAPGIDSSLLGLSCVTYKGTPATVTAGAEIFRADEIRVGNVFDTQRRRRNQYDESYVAVPLSGAQSNLIRVNDRRVGRN